MGGDQLSHKYGILKITFVWSREHELGGEITVYFIRLLPPSLSYFVIRDLLSKESQCCFVSPAPRVLYSFLSVQENKTSIKYLQRKRKILTYISFDDILKVQYEVYRNLYKLSGYNRVFTSCLWLYELAHLKFTLKYVHMYQQIFL